MKINLTKSVRLEDLCRVNASGCPVEEVGEIIFSFSPEAILGFATELIWLYEDIGNRKIMIDTHQLGVDPGPSQAIGFYLTPSSPTLVLKVNSLNEDKISSYHDIKSYEIDIRNKNTNQHYEVAEPVDETDGALFLEAYEISRRNIINIAVVDKNGNNITKKCSVVSFEINRDGIKSLATMLLVWLHSYKQDEYLLTRIGQQELGYNLGVVLTSDSIATRFRCCDLGQIYQYDSRM